MGMKDWAARKSGNRGQAGVFRGKDPTKLETAIPKIRQSGKKRWEKVHECGGK